MPPSVPFRTSPTREQVRETTKRREEKPAAKSHGSGGGTTTANRNKKAASSAEEHVTPATASTSNMLNDNSALLPVNQLGMLGATSGIYGGMNSMMYGGGGMMGSPYGMMGAGPLSGLNQMLFSVQSVIFSLGQAVQIVGMNTQALHQLLDTATSMFDHALSTFQEMRALDARALQDESPEDQTKRRRLKALRWAFIMSIAYGGYRLIRRLMRKRQSHRQLTMYPAQQQYSSGYAAPPTTLLQAPSAPPQAYGGSPYGSSPYAMSNPHSSYYGAGGGYGGYF